ncbi:MAG: sel1 repeat family protein [Parachlamydiaceae bacterium]|nr:MAG: sel1 repeat family protein [Parachlamydiaceae bacterium]
MKRGIKYIKLAADQGHAIAQVTFGKMLAAGTGVKKNPQEAFKYYELSAAQNNSEAQCLAAIFYGNKRTLNLLQKFYRKF